MKNSKKDTITEFVMKTASVNIDKYMIAGASKRGSK